MSRRVHGDRGFTLVEVLVAFLIGALALGALLRLVGVGLEATGSLDGRTTALLEARARLAAVGVAEPLVEGVTTGALADGSWSVAIRAVETSPDGLFTLFEVLVEVTHADGSRAALTSYRLGGAELEE